MNELQVFNFNNNPVRIEYSQNQIWFCLIDVCNVLEITDRHQLRARLNPRGLCLIHTPCGKGGRQKTYYVNEPNLYRAILKSDKPEAQEFEDWICEEVLPTIRKTGGYSVAAQVDMKAIGGIVKKCVNKALTEFLSNDLPTSGDDNDVLRQKYYNITDQNMVEMFQRWYWSRNYDVRKVIDSQNQKIEELETKLRMVQKVVC